MARSAKKKQEKVAKPVSIDDWEPCSECNLLIHSSEVDNHLEECMKHEASVDELEESFLSSIFDTSHVGTLPQSFIKDEVFYGTVEAINSAKYAPLLNLTFMKEWRNIVFLNPSTMRKCNIGLYSDYVTIKGKHSCSLYIAYPLRFVKNSVAAFQRNGGSFKLKEKIIIQSYRGCVSEAVEILISCNKKPRINAELKRQLLRKLYKTFVFVGMKINISFLGCTYEFTIQNILDQHHKSDSESCKKTGFNKRSTDSRIGDICELSNLNLSDSIDFNVTNFSSASFQRSTIMKNESFLSSTPQSASGKLTREKLNFSKYLTRSFCDENISYYRISPKTVLNIQEKEESKDNNLYSFNDIGGLNKQLQYINKYLELFLQTEKKAKCDILMLSGPSGTGKTLVLNAICKEYNVHIERLHWFEILSGNDVEVGIKKISSIFKTAVKCEPSIIIIDEFNYLCPGKNGILKRNFHQIIMKKLSSEIENLPVHKKVLILAAANEDYNDFISHLRGKMYEIVKFSIPTTEERKHIFEKILHKRKHNLTPVQINEISDCAPGFTGKDFLCVIKEAETRSFRRGTVDHDAEICPVDCNDIIKYLKLRKNSITTNEDAKPDKVQWCDIGGMQEVKSKLKQVVEEHKSPEVMKMFNINPTRGVLMYGPPGCSKTMIAKAIANESGFNFIAKKSADLFNKLVGESEKAVRDLFHQAKSARPCVIFFDEIDALVAERGISGESGVGNRIVTTLLTEIDGIEELRQIIIIAATNRPDLLDDALIRNGRINHFIYVPLPNEQAREEIFKIQMKSRSVSDDVDIKQLAQKTEGYTGAEVVNICNEAAMNLLMEDFPAVKSAVFRMHHFEKAINTVLPRTTKETLEFYEKYNLTFNSKI